jgi:hypothetical protein
MEGMDDNDFDNHELLTHIQIIYAGYKKKEMIAS